MSKKATGISKLHYATYTESTEGAVTYAAPVRIPDCEELSAKNTYAEGDNYADNLQNIYVSKVTGADLDITLSALSKKIEAALTGKAYEKGEIETNTADIQQKVAILYQINYDDGSYDNRIYYNCKLRKEEYGGKTQTDKIDFSACTITGKAIPLSNGKVFYEIASDEVTEEDTSQKKKLDNFFKTVQFKDIEDSTAGA